VEICLWWEDSPSLSLSLFFAPGAHFYILQSSSSRSDSAESLHQHERPGVAEGDEARPAEEAGAGDVGFRGEAVRPGAVWRLDYGLRWSNKWRSLGRTRVDRIHRIRMHRVYFCLREVKLGATEKEKKRKKGKRKNEDALTMHNDRNNGL